MRRLQWTWINAGADKPSPYPEPIDLRGDAVLRERAAAAEAERNTQLALELVARQEARARALAAREEG